MKEYSTNISIRILVSKLMLLDTEADKLNITRNELVNNIIDKYLKEVK